MKSEILHERIEYPTVRALVEDAAERYGDRVAYSFKKNPHKKEITKKTYQELRDDVRALASPLVAMGCGGKHIALVGALSYDWALVYFAALSVGAVLVPLDRDWLAEDLADTVSKADADYLFIEEELAEKTAAIEKKATLSVPAYHIACDSSDRPLSVLIEEGRLLYDANPDAYHNAPIDPDSLSLLVFTSGTTGKGKGVMLTQSAILQDMAAVIPYIDFGEKTVSVLPPHHTYGSTVMLIGHTMVGCEVYISAGLRYIGKELKAEKPQHLILVPLYLETFYRKILATVKEQGKEKLLLRMIRLSEKMRRVGIDMRKKLFASVREAFGGEIKTVVSGGAPINPEIISFFDSIGITTLNGYGITECAPIIAVNRSRRIVHGSVGPVLDIDTVIIDEPNGEGEGEILVKGINVMLGYYKDEAATRDAFTEEGYFRTGDYGKLSEDNVLTITGRKKNLIILSNGKNVYPEEIENELISTPGILDIVVYEGQSKRGMEHNAIVAEVFPDADFIDKNGIEDIQAYLKPFVDRYNKTAVPYKKIGILKIRKTEFPKNTLRKIMRFKLDTTIE